MKLEKVVPFGRSLAEYRLMFDLSPEDLQKRSITPSTQKTVVLKS
ncbi:MAG: hypothetical protein AAGE96_03795 [Cyanobacteria bacterium P01_G01_bin.19]